jgi:23S rRNA (guanosine2251-2'-O)-methyltransferase
MRKLKTSELNRKNIEEFQNAEKSPVVIVLDNVRSMNNVGSIFRTSDAFLVQKIYLCGITGTPPHREITKTAIGAEKSVEWEYHANTLEVVNDLKTKGYIVYSIEQASDSADLMTIDYPQGKLAFVFGNEIDGVQQEVINASHHCLEIPQLGTKHSFNVAVTCGIVLWDFIKFRNTVLTKLTIWFLAVLFAVSSCTNSSNSHPPKQNDVLSKQSDEMIKDNSSTNNNDEASSRVDLVLKSDEVKTGKASIVKPDEYIQQADYSVMVSYSVDCPMCNRYTADLVKIQQQINALNKSNLIAQKMLNKSPEKAIKRPQFQLGLIQVNSDENWDMDGFNPSIEQITISDQNHDFVKRFKFKMYPEVVLVNAQGQVVYRGKIDDRAVSTGVVRSVAKNYYLKEAINQLYQGQKITTPTTRAQGCYIEVK